MYFQWYFREIVNNRPVSRKSIKLKLIRKKSFSNLQISLNVKESLVSLHFLYSAGYQKWWGFQKKVYVILDTCTKSILKNIIVKGDFMRKYKQSLNLGFGRKGTQKEQILPFPFHLHFDPFVPFPFLFFVQCERSFSIPSPFLYRSFSNLSSSLMIRQKIKSFFRRIIVKFQ